MTSISIHNAQNISDVRFTPNNANMVSFTIEITDYQPHREQITIFGLSGNKAAILTKALEEIAAA